MEKYTSKLINDYINGNDIDGYEIDDLENDYEFMEEVINSSNDKNFYNLCSDEVKVNHDFVLFLIDKFKSDGEFVGKVVGYYLRNNKKEDSINHLDIVLLAYSYTGNDSFLAIANTIYQVDRINIEAYKLQEKDQDKVDFIGMGFISVFDIYHNNEMVLDFYAKNLISDIFEENDIDLEGLLHNRFKNVKELEDVGIRTFLVRFIESFDDMLSSYISTHIGLLDDLVKKVEKIVKKWDKYNDVTEIRNYNMILDKIHIYYEESEHLGTLTEDQVLYYVGRELGILDELRKYDTIELVEYMEKEGIHDDEFDDGWNIDDKELDEEISFNLANKMIVTNALRIAEGILKPTLPTEQEIEIEKNGGKVSSFRG